MCPDDANYCPFCGTDFPETENRPSSSIGEGNTFTGGVHVDAAHSNSDERSSVRVGDNNTFTGGVHSEDKRTTTNSNNKTNSDNVNKTNSDNTTINNYWPQKSKSALLEEDLLRYRLKCKEFYKNGFISRDAEEQLRILQERLALRDEFVLPIKKEEQQKSRVPSKELSLGVIAGINNTKSIIEQNSSDAIRRHLRQLESWMQVYDDDSLRSWYYQLSSMLEPLQFTERFEKSAKDDYWHRYWAHIAFLLQNKEEKAFEASACLGVLQANHPEHDEVLLLLVGRLIQNEPIDNIKNEFNTGTLYCSPELQLLFDTVNELLGKKWSMLWEVIPGTLQVRRSGEHVVRAVHSFYANILFKSFVNAQIESGKKQREEEERISRAERERQEEINRQKGYLLKGFENVEDIDKACAELGIPYLTLQGWIKEDSSFNSKYNAIVLRIEEKRKEEAEKIRIAHETEARITQQKSQFIQLYGQNDCDFIKTCSDLTIGSDTVKMWRSSDKAFDDGLTIIEREHEKKLQDLFLQFYESNGCDLQKASAETGVGVDDVNSWRKSNKSFNEVLISIENEHVQAQKDAFIRCYKQNECNPQKTCSELGIYLRTVEKWRHEDGSFDEELKIIEKSYADLVHEEETRQKSQFIVAYKSNKGDMPKACTDTGIPIDTIREWRNSDMGFDKNLRIIKNQLLWKVFLSKVLPLILILSLSVFIVCRIQTSSQKTKMINHDYEKLIDAFNNSLSKVEKNDYGVAALEDAVKSLSEIKAFEQVHKDLQDPKYSTLRQEVMDRCDSLFVYYRTQATPTIEDPSLNQQDHMKYGKLRDSVKVIKSKL